jgi:hypothetical protein
MLPFLILTSLPAQAEEPYRISGLRVGFCAGISTECYLAGLKLEYAWRLVAINVNMPVVPLWGGANLKLYPFDIREGEPRRARPYAYGGVARARPLSDGGLVGDIIFGFDGYSTGVGVDVHAEENHAVIFQPSFGIGSVPEYGGRFFPVVAMSLMGAF